MTGVTRAVSSVSVERKEGDVHVFREARWLAGEEIKRTWLSYPVTALTTLVAGLFVAATVDGILTVEGVGEAGRGFEYWYNTFFTDFLFLAFGTFLSVNWMSREYFRVFSEDVFSERLAFMRGLPISSTTLVVGRMISMCLSLLLNAPAFFVPVYLVSGLNRLGWDFLWFVAVWIGFSLFGTGLFLLAELGLQGKTYVRLSFATVPVLMAVIGFLEWSVGLRAVARITGLAEAYGPLSALAALLTILTRATIRRVGRRDLHA